MRIMIDGEAAYECKHHPNYFVTKTGLVYSTYVRGGNGKVDVENPRLLSYGQDKDGYFRVVLCANRHKRYVKVHTLIAEQFIGDVVPPSVVNHKDGNKKNNRVNNLEIVSVKYNTRHAHTNGMTTSEIPVEVVFEGRIYKCKSLTECMEKFPDLSRHYLQQLRNQKPLFSIVRFERKESDNRHSKISAYYNGTLFMEFGSMKEADLFFCKSPGSTSAAIKNSRYRDKVNKYHVSFPNVSTIESAVEMQ